jgi:N-acetylmuramoyl-L-alanine amidase
VAARASTRRASVAVALLASLGAMSLGPAPARAGADIAGMTVFLDPGHNGANDSSITRQVPDGRGGTKDCETTGAETNDGYPEHTFTWEVTLAIRDALNQMGVHT